MDIEEKFKKIEESHETTTRLIHEVREILTPTDRSEETRVAKSLSELIYMYYCEEKKRVIGLISPDVWLILKNDPNDEDTDHNLIDAWIKDPNCEVITAERAAEILLSDFVPIIKKDEKREDLVIFEFN